MAITQRRHRNVRRRERVDLCAQRFDTGVVALQTRGQTEIRPAEEMRRFRAETEPGQGRKPDQRSFSKPRSEGGHYRSEGAPFRSEGNESRPFRSESTPFRKEGGGYRNDSPGFRADRSEGGIRTERSEGFRKEGGFRERGESTFRNREGGYNKGPRSDAPRRPWGDR